MLDTIALFLGSFAVQTQTPKLTPVVPSTAEPGINTQFNAPNEVGDPVGIAKGRLFVFLPGTNGSPAGYKKIVEEGLRQGYNGIGLEYPDGPKTVHDDCKTSTDPACPGDIRNEVVTGADTSPLVHVTPPDSIVGRLTSLLGYLAKHDPAGGWNQYLSGGAIVWSRVTVGGHSQGGGMTSYIGKLENAPDLCDFDSPSDDDPTNQTAPAAWLSMPNVTPAALQFGFTNKQDQVAYYPLVSADWATIGLPAANQLTVSVAGSSKGASHGLTVEDGITPPGPNGLPLYTPKWDAVCFSH